MHDYFFMMCTLHPNILFYILFLIMCFKQCFMKVFTVFSWFEVWNVSPLKHENNKILVLHVFKGEKCQSSNQEKMGGNLLLVLFLFTRPIILAKGIIWYNAISNFKNIFWKMPAIWDTLMDVWSLSKNYPGFSYDIKYWFY